MSDPSANYDKLKTSNMTNYKNTNTTAIPNIVKEINNNLKELTLVQNELNKENNINQEILVKKDQLLKMKNDDLMKQLRELEIIQSNIENKNRIIEQTNDNINKQNTNINNLIISAVLAALLFIAVFLYGSGKLDKGIFSILLIIIILCYLLLFIYTYNIFYLKDAVFSIFNYGNVVKIENSVLKWADQIETRASNELNEIKQSWIQTHCDCPIEEEQNNSDIYSNVQNVSTKEIPGYFYYDGTAPAQLLVPTPDPKIGLNEKIDWVDYSSNGSMKYNPTTNKVSNDNKNYYNYKQNNPEMNFKKLLDKSDKLVNRNTYTSNL
jgi:hypothetical protein